MSQISHYLNIAFHCYYTFFFVFDLYPCTCLINNINKYIVLYLAQGGMTKQ